MSPPPAPTGPEGAARGSVAGDAAGPPSTVELVCYREPLARMAGAPPETLVARVSSIIGAARMTTGESLVFLDHGGAVRVEDVPQAVKEHLRRHGASAP